MKSIETAVETIIKSEGRIDVVVNNAALALAGHSETVTIEQVSKVFDVNFLGVVRMLQAVLPHMREKRKGHIISIGSVSAIGAPTGLQFYAASKSALESLHEGEAAMLAQYGIKMTLLQAGTIATNTKHMAEKVMMGERTDYKKNMKDGEVDLYERQIKNKHAGYMHYVRTSALDVESVSSQIVEIILSPPEKVHPFVQTEGEAELYAQSHNTDPTGEEKLDYEMEQTKFFLS
eukprot:TRINITY_DN6795_c0_g1_i1.p1 TRINITY_DN6795_c0_g1~~TRINITY_DN6795_c0_g1_i1.p1  ORF type:complete len:233 (+),score=36.38 TRINITY_DN6795_c0_g1_i1:215-913(+)